MFLFDIHLSIVVECLLVNILAKLFTVVTIVSRLEGCLKFLTEGNQQIPVVLDFMAIQTFW